MNSLPERTDGGACVYARRRFLLAAGAGIGLAPGVQGTEQTETTVESFTIYNETTKLPLNGDGAAIIKNASDLGAQLHTRHGGCCRCTVAALQQALEMVPEHPGLFRAATCLDAGAAPGAKLSCGCFTGAGIVIGYICGGENFSDRSLAHKLIQQVARKFQKTYGSVLCEDARKGGKCHVVVGRAVQWTAEVLLAQFCGYTSPSQG